MDRRQFLGMIAITPAVMRAESEGAELAVMVIDRVHPDIFASQTHLKRGDVIEVLPAGANWGSSDRTDTHCIIFKVPGLAMVEANALKTVDPGNRRVNPMLHARAFGLDFRAFPGSIQALIGDGRQRMTEHVTLTPAMIRAAKYRKAPLPNPFIIG
jgi:hypothetical protein